LILLTLSIALLIWSALRWKGTPQFHPEYGVRRDTAILFALLLLGVVGDAVRVRYPDVSIPFLAISLGLIPIAIGAVAVLIRLIKEYRLAHQTTFGNKDPHLSARDRRE
jgi:hypothetical protein